MANIKHAENRRKATACNNGYKKYISKFYAEDKNNKYGTQIKNLTSIILSDAKGSSRDEGSDSLCIDNFFGQSDPDSCLSEPLLLVVNDLKNKCVAHNF